uniref:AAA ATPase domain-containing protein n=1 Tax=Candidatus Kentrum sp. UNK TaxID=2126344 RepID=A0A451AK67_9GAMM|nr:MAG: AAA ATPase domain-containing protein [Candidatus Kentron sp. UNK]VFK72021.1 MAG: AAA ATPase domain-containing protein [Candidatus Kentron sp. UNK]
MARIFLSHATRDKEKALALLEWLREQGYERTFLDSDQDTGIPAGADWERALYRELERSQALVILLTRHWTDSKWCFAEFTQARALGKAIFPVIETPVGELVVGGDLQAINLTHERNDGLQRLARALAEVSLSSAEGFEFREGISPFPGFSAFSEAQAAVFFGREDDIGALIERLRRTRTQGGARFIPILGASGSGKSSLMRAGLLPRLKRDPDNWCVIDPFRPYPDASADPANRLIAQLLAAARGSVPAQPGGSSPALPIDVWREQMKSNDPAPALQAIAETIRDNTGRLDASLLITIDQAEELFALADKPQRQAFMALLSHALDGTLPYFAVATMRSEYLGELQGAPGLSVRFEPYNLQPMPLERIGALVRGPARLAHLEVEDGLVAELMSDAGTSDALPLIAFTLQRLYEVERDGGKLTHAGYIALGDPDHGLTPLDNAVRKTVEEALPTKQRTAGQDKALKRAFIPNLVEINADGNFVRRPAVLDRLPEIARDDLQGLIDARLLVTRSERVGDIEQTIVEVAHEALFRVWDWLATWINEEKDLLVGRMRIEQAFEDWLALMVEDREQHKGLLGGVLLERARQWITDRSDAFDAEEQSYIRNSIDHADALVEQEKEKERRAARLRRRLLVTAVAAAVIFAVASVVVGIFWRDSEEARRQLTEREQDLKERTRHGAKLGIERAKASAKEGKLDKALNATIEAGKNAIAVEDLELQEIVTVLLDEQLRKKARLKVFPPRNSYNTGKHIGFQGQEHLVFELLGGILIWDSSDGTARWVMPSPPTYGSRVIMHPNGRFSAHLGRDLSNAAFLDIDSGKTILRLEGEFYAEKPQFAAQAPVAALLEKKGKGIRIIHLENPKIGSRIDLGNETLQINEDNPVRLFAGWQSKKRLLGKPLFDKLRLAASGDKLLLPFERGCLQVRLTGDPKHAATTLILYRERPNLPNATGYPSPDGDSVFIVGESGGYGLWSLAKRDWVWKDSSGGSVNKAKFSPTGRRLLVDDGTRYLLWNIASKDSGAKIEVTSTGRKFLGFTPDEKGFLYADDRDLHLVASPVGNPWMNALFPSNEAKISDEVLLITTSSIEYAGLSADRNLLVVSEEAGTSTWNINPSSIEPLVTLPQKSIKGESGSLSVTSIALGDRKNTLWVGTDKGSVLAYSLAQPDKPRINLRLPSGTIIAGIAPGNAGDALILTGKRIGKAVKVSFHYWNGTERYLVAEVDNFSPGKNGENIVFAESTTVAVIIFDSAVYRVAGRDVTKILDIEDNRKIEKLALSANGISLAIVEQSKTQEGLTRVMVRRNDEFQMVWEGKTSHIGDHVTVELDPMGRYFAFSLSKNRNLDELVLRDLETGNRWDELPYRSILGFRPDGKLLIKNNYNDTLGKPLRDIAGQPLPVIPVPSLNESIFGSNRLIASLGNRSLITEIYFEVWQTFLHHPNLQRRIIRDVSQSTVLVDAENRILVGKRDGTIGIVPLYSLESLLYAARARQISQPAVTKNVPVVMPMQSGKVHLCDRLAAHPDDPRRVAIGVTRDTFDEGEAEEACQVALEQKERKEGESENGTDSRIRWRYQYARALGEGASRTASIEHYRHASDLGYPMASFALAKAHEEGWRDNEGNWIVEKDPNKATDLYQQAYKGDVRMAASSLARIHFQRDSPNLHRTSIERLEKLATEGDKWAHKELADLYDGKYPSTKVNRIPEKALFHHLLAAGLAANTPYREQFRRKHQVAAHNHAALMDIETAAEIVKAAECWEIGKQRSDVMKIDEKGKVLAVCGN